MLSRYAHIRAQAKRAAIASLESMVEDPKIAPDRIKKRGIDWGTATLDQHVAQAWTPFARWVSERLRVERISTDTEIETAYLELLAGKVDPAAGIVVER